MMEPTETTCRYAMSKTATAFSLPVKVKMWHFNDIFNKDLDIWNESSGPPWHDVGYKTKKDIKDDAKAINKVRYFWHRVKNGEEMKPPNYPQCLTSKSKNKWVYPATISFGEAVFTLPLLAAYKEGGPIAFGYEEVSNRKKISNRFNHHNYYVRLEFDKLDETVPKWLIERAFDVLMINVDFGHYEDHGIPDARKMVCMWDYLTDYFIKATGQSSSTLQHNMNICCHSYFSPLIISICSYFLCQWICLNLTNGCAEDIITLENDSLMATEKKIDLNRAKALLDFVGLKLNIEKSQVTKNLNIIKFLD